MHHTTPVIHEQLGRMRQQALLDEARAAQAAMLVKAGRRKRHWPRTLLGLVPVTGGRHPARVRNTRPLTR